MKVVAIAAVASNGVIGSGSGMLWHLPEDWRRFKQVTMGHTLVLGRRTFEEIGALPGRPAIVCTRDADWHRDGVRVAHDVAGALEMAREAGEEICFVAGGAQIYAAALDLCDELDITEVHQSPDGSARFPAIDPERWRETTREPRAGFDFVRYERIDR
ncbi:dihydrofolate reductase [Acidipropionibacterium timonense]|uniref:dihydrofolate reductase n=1 Tax=Acidipropionibacterium timonense TaxID=2161818 RepID=UPI00102FD5E8|nr:dihydrofolate reductase [Acidipropionibacterium timonense]